MKAKTILGMIACASACVSLSAFGNTTNAWFSVGADGGSISTNKCVASVETVTISGNVINLDNDKDSAFVVNNFASAATSDGIVKISATAVLTPNSTNDFEAVSGAKAGFAVGIDDQNATNFYGYANGVWNKFINVDPEAPDESTDFTLILNYRDGNVSYYVGNTLLVGEVGESVGGSLTLASGTAGLASIDAYGYGSITSIAGGYEVAAAQYGDKAYGSITEASDAAKAASEDPTESVQVVSSDGTPVQANAKAGNGLPMIVCEALGLATDSETANIAVAPVATDDDKTKITLQLAMPIVPERGAVGFKISGDETVYGADEIKIPLTSGIYTITPVLK